MSTDKPPIALAGPDQVITLPTDSILLDGSASNDPDGTISEWLWTKISGPASFNIIKPNDSLTPVKNLTVGLYQFELKVTDTDGLSDRDTVQIIVNNTSQTNHPPVANAGPDQTIILPQNALTLDGRASTDPDNNITTYEWRKVSGPSSFAIVNANSSQTSVTNLVQGNYQFELKVTDAGGLIDRDTTELSVIPQPQPCNDCKIVFVSGRDGNDEIYSFNSNSNNITRLTFNAATDDHPAWSPDGTLIAFVSNRTGVFELYIMNADGSNVVRKTFSGSTGAYNPAWSPDGTKIAYSTDSGSNTLNIWIVDVMSSSASFLFNSTGWDSNPAWSPDGTKLAIVSDWAAYDIAYDIYTIKSDGTGFTALTGNNILDGVDYLSPSWSPTGTKIAMAIRQTTGIDQYNTHIGIMSSNSSGINVLRSDAWPWTTASWSGDGTRIAYTSKSGLRMDISWVAANGSEWGIIVANGWNADWKR